MGNTKSIGIILVFLTTLTLFMTGINQGIETVGFDSGLTKPEEGESPPERAGWDIFGWFTTANSLSGLFNILTFNIFGIPEGLQSILQIVVYTPIALITLIIAANFIRGF